ncbi:tRNA 2-thiouridine(34) synthase MnmA [Arthrobacter sp. zg-Y40]|uniref:tRNA 2-thiouridine(34) synthase MnmA n=1 Tax=unclassified Arthrobacter TaxID=235627 RepID=UPI001D142487|nr:MULTISPECIES: tRNA 2-thiouridine(34) synthase MnmA [unclassified Arthrobacter]MCC3277753.1 tRNA 2-thiouridine(34) synthase MnmA [Arthrobacter sp. zg-Y40]MDK1327153.1 tRNA 2-thiouridine(34) synthase MnmA [Arthrobacter sp. zg-Y1143]
MKVLAAMSGGVDSAVAAARAVEAGHDVVGVHLALSRMPGTLRTGSRGCCTIEDSRDAWRACDILGIPYYVWDFSERFKEDVVDDFVAEYAAGRTPNPCMRCNERIKFAALLEKALALGFDAVCTGHYAKVITNPEGNPELHRAADWAKDQSYVLGVLTEEQLRHCMFPLAETPSKAEVRAEAERRGLSVANKPDSHDICFIPDGDTRGWLEERIDMSEGDIVDETGQKLGTHPGANAYTVGQRRGLKLGTPAADGKPRFVLEIRPKENKVVVGPEQLLNIDQMRGTKISWAGVPIPEIAARTRFDCTVQVRAHGDPVAATGWMEDVADEATGAVRGELVVRLTEPMRGVAPGQSMVLYQGTRVLGQATIDSARSLEWDPAAVS